MAWKKTEKIELPHKYVPREYQIPFWRAMKLDRKRRAYIIWHRRSGKDKTMLNYVISEMFERVGTYYYFFPTYAQAKKVLWDGMDRDGFKFLKHIPDRLIKKRNETEMQIEAINGSILQFVGSDNMDRVVGTNPVGVVYAEWPLQDPMAYELFRPILRENDGWAIFNGTPRGKNHGYGLYKMAKDNPDWFCELLTVRDTKRPDGTPVVSEEDIQKDRDEGMEEHLIEQEYYCSFEGRVEGSYYSEIIARAEVEGRITSVPWDTSKKVHTFWDLGRNDRNCIWFMQEHGRELRVIDYHENYGKGIDFYARYLKEDKPYTYGRHYWPHDGAVKDYSATGNRSRKQIAEELGLRPIYIVPKIAREMDGIQAVRAIFSRCVFDEKKCSAGLSALRAYHADKLTEGSDEEPAQFSDKPVHDWSSHGSKAFETLARGWRDSELMDEETFYVDEKSDIREISCYGPSEYSWMGH